MDILVPATTANLGPGFDSLGLALRLYNRVRVWPSDDTAIEISGHGASELARDEGNLMLRAAAELSRRYSRQLPPLHWRAHHDIPLSRGLGSSSAAIVAGLLAANEVLGLGLRERELVEVAAEIEGHPDNVAPAILGGLTICLPQSKPLRVLRIKPHPDLRLVLCIPATQVSTEKARKVLPDAVPFADAVFNLSRAAGMVAALSKGFWDALAECCRDRLHQPYRMSLLAAGQEIMAAALEAGAKGVAVSGSGPTIAAFADGRLGTIARAMLEAARQAMVEACVVVTAPDRAGARVRRGTD